MTAIESKPIAVGATAPDFTLASTSGESVTLTDFRGKSDVLVAFFPLAFTGTCTTEMCSFSEDFDDFSGVGVVVLPISVDSKPTLQEFKNKYAMKVDMLSDFKREASRAFGVLNEEAFHARRSYFLIDKSGVVRWEHVEEKSGMRRDNKELLAEISRMQGK